MKKQLLETGDRSIKPQVGGGRSSSSFAQIDPRRTDYDTANGIGYPKKTVVKPNSGPHGINKVKDKEPINVAPTINTVKYDAFGNEEPAEKTPTDVGQNNSKSPEISQELRDQWRQETIDRILKLAGMEGDPVNPDLQVDSAPHKAIIQANTMANLEKDAQNREYRNAYDKFANQSSDAEDPISDLVDRIQQSRGEISVDDANEDYDNVSTTTTDRSYEQDGKFGSVYRSDSIQKDPKTGKQQQSVQWSVQHPVTGKTYSGSAFTDADGNVETDNNVSEELQRIRKLSGL